MALPAFSRTSGEIVVGVPEPSTLLTKLEAVAAAAGDTCEGSPTKLSTVLRAASDAATSISPDVSGTLSSAKFNNCVFNDNKHDGIQVHQSTIHLHGEASALYSNGLRGIYASNSAKVLIHLPSHHNTSYNNGGQDRKTSLFL